MKQTEIACPFCGHKQTFEIVNEINPGNDFSLKQRLLNFDLFKCECTQCEKSIPIVYDTLYHDFQRKLIVVLSTQELSFKVMLNLQKDLEERYGDLQGYQLRVVNNPDDLREKVLLNDLEIDDRLIELVKFYYSTIVREQNPEIQISQILFIHQPGQKNQLGFLLKSKQTFKVEINDEVVNKLKETYSLRLSQGPIKLSKIDFDWAYEFINQKN